MPPEPPRGYRLQRAFNQTPLRQILDPPQYLNFSRSKYLAVLLLFLDDQGQFQILPNQMELEDVHIHQQELCHGTANVKNKIPLSSFALKTVSGFYSIGDVRRREKGRGGRGDRHLNLK